MRISVNIVNGHHAARVVGKSFGFFPFVFIFGAIVMMFVCAFGIAAMSILAVAIVWYFGRAFIRGFKSGYRAELNRRRAMRNR